MKDAGVQICPDDGGEDLGGIDESGERRCEERYCFFAEFVAG